LYSLSQGRCSIRDRVKREVVAISTSISLPDGNNKVRDEKVEDERDNGGDDQGLEVDLVPRKFQEKV